MSIINITCNQSGLQVGRFKRQLLTSESSMDCCNTHWHGHFWCPKKKWFMNKMCIFTDKYECTLWEDQCYGKTY